MSSLTVVELVELDELDPSLVTADDWRAAMGSLFGAGTTRPRAKVETVDDVVLEDVELEDDQDELGFDGPKKKHRHEGVRRARDRAYRERMFALAPDVPHPVMPIQGVLPLVDEVLRELPLMRSKLQRMRMRDALQAVCAALCEALHTPLRWRGGNDCARGFGTPGSEWPQLAALLRGTPAFSDTAVRNLFIAWEDSQEGFRAPRLAPIPIKCKRSGNQHPNRFERNDVYLGARTLRLWAKSEWLRPLVEALRARAPEWMWVQTKLGRRWRRLGLTYLESITMRFVERREELRKRRENAQVWDAARAARRREKKKRCLHALQEAVQTVPISPTSHSERDLCEDGAAAPAPAGLASGSQSKDGAAAPAPSRSVTAPVRSVDPASSPEAPAIAGATEGEVHPNVWMNQPWAVHRSPDDRPPAAPAPAAPAPPLRASPPADTVDRADTADPSWVRFLAPDEVPPAPPPATADPPRVLRTVDEVRSELERRGLVKHWMRRRPP